MGSRNVATAPRTSKANPLRDGSIIRRRTHPSPGALIEKSALPRRADLRREWPQPDIVEPGLVAEIRHSAEHVIGITKVLDVKARWLGHKLHTDVAILVDGHSTVGDADNISASLKRELFAHIPVLSVANVRVHGTEIDAPGVAGGSHPQGHQR
jgi:Dimerisation domain of Zinc Transporter